MERYIGMEVGPYRLAFVLTDVRQILEMGGPGAGIDPRALGVTPVSLAAALGQETTTKQPALLLLDGEIGPILCSVCRLRGIRRMAQCFPFPTTAALLWPGLIRNAITTLDDDDLYFVMDKVVLVAIIQQFLGDGDPKRSLPAPGEGLVL
ncbi:MAG: hypothetical protein GY822_27905 [Deltaproteobacteria bacterium]|nr:hypothetical protein [Deltaproteobacteria bacterium]